MLTRYSRKIMLELWSELKKKTCWHQVEVAILQAKVTHEGVPAEVHHDAASLEITPEILAIADEFELIGDHDLIAFIQAVCTRLNKLTKVHYHTGVTSFDTEDTALALLLVQAMDIIISQTKKLRATILFRAIEHKHMVMIGRTHLIHAEPITFGLKLLNFVDTLDRHLARLQSVREEIRMGKISGAVGRYSLNPKIEATACEILGLKPARISTQILNRDLISNQINCLVGVSNSLDKMATDIRLLAGTDLGEVAEYKASTAKGSSAMPGKSFLRNPIKSENVCSLARTMRGYATMANQNETLWQERTLDNSALERIMIPDAFTLLDFMLERFTQVMAKLEVFPDQMQRNLARTGGIVFAQQVMIALTEKGMPRDTAYDLLEGLAKSVERGTFVDGQGRNFRYLVTIHPQVRELLSYTEIETCFNPQTGLKHVDEIFTRFA